MGNDVASTSAYKYWLGWVIIFAAHLGILTYENVAGHWIYDGPVLFIVFGWPFSYLDQVVDRQAEPTRWLTFRQVGYTNLTILLCNLACSSIIAILCSTVIWRFLCRIRFSWSIRGWLIACSVAVGYLLGTMQFEMRRLAISDGSIVRFGSIHDLDRWLLLSDTTFIDLITNQCQALMVATSFAVFMNWLVGWRWRWLANNGWYTDNNFFARKKG